MPIAAAPGPNLRLPSPRLARCLIAADRAAHVLSPKRERRIVALLLAAWVINLFDLGFTLLAREQRLLTELNPLAVHVIGYGVGAVVLYKLLLLTIGTGILWSQRRRRSCEVILWGYAILCLGLAMHWRSIYRDAQPEWMEASILDELAPVNIHLLADGIVRKESRSDPRSEPHRADGAPADRTLNNLKATGQNDGDRDKPAPQSQRPAEYSNAQSNGDKR